MKKIKLTLKTSTIRTLSGPQLDAVHGGTFGCTDFCPPITFECPTNNGCPPKTGMTGRPICLDTQALDCPSEIYCP